MAQHSLWPFHYHGFTTPQPPKCRLQFGRQRLNQHLTISRYRLIPTDVLGRWKWCHYNLILTDNPIPTDCSMLKWEIPTDIYIQTNCLLKLIATDSWTLYLFLATNNQTLSSQTILQNQAIIMLTLIIADNN